MGKHVSQTLPQPLLDVRGVTLQYKTRDHLVTATYRVDFAVQRSDRFVLLGPSGCGKSTLLKAVGGYMAPVDTERLLQQLREVAAATPTRQIRLDADADARFEDVVRIVDLCQFNGLKNVGLHTRSQNGH